MSPLSVILLAWAALAVGFVFGALWAAAPRGDRDDR